MHNTRLIQIVGGPVSESPYGRHSLIEPLGETLLEPCLRAGIPFVVLADGALEVWPYSEERYDFTSFHTDVAALVELGLLEKNDHGTLTVPFDEIVIHAGIRDAA